VATAAKLRTVKLNNAVAGYTGQDVVLAAGATGGHSKKHREGTCSIIVFNNSGDKSTGLSRPCVGLPLSFLSSLTSEECARFTRHVTRRDLVIARVSVLRSDTLTQVGSSPQAVAKSAFRSASNWSLCQGKSGIDSRIRPLS
jgi:hypothetical protein